MTDDDITYSAAINLRRDTIESRRLPSGLPVEPDAAALHERVARHFEQVRTDHREKIRAPAQQPK